MSKKQKDLIDGVFGQAEEQEDEVEDTRSARREELLQEQVEEYSEYEPSDHPENDEEDEAEEPVAKKPAKKDKDNIPLAKYLEEKNSWKQKLKEWEEKEGKYRMIEDHLDNYYQQQEQQKNQAAIPNFDDDPAAHLDHRTKELQQLIEQQREQLEQITQGNQRSQQMQQVMQRVGDMEQEFMRETPDYNEALNYLRDLKMREFQMIGQYNNWSESDIKQQMTQLEINTAIQAMQMGANPAEFVYGIAKTYGYKPGEGTGSVRAEGDAVDRKIKGIKSSKGSRSSPGERTERTETDDYNSVSAFNDAVSDLFPNAKMRKRV